MVVKKSTSKMKRKSSKVKSTSKTAAKKTTKATVKKAAAIKIPAIKESLSKSNMIKFITDATSINKKEVVAVLECLSQVIKKHVQPGGPGTFVMPGLWKINVVKKPARKARKGVNPFTGEEIMIKAKPASKAVKIRPLKKLKEMVL